jgi:imidazole glycerol phosphate synthase glutamine amidotransferase subunit
MIAVLDYGAGNTGSVLKAIRHLGYCAASASSPEQLQRASKLIFPGQGHFGAMLQGLEERRLVHPLRRWLLEERPFLGICLGLQVLYEASEESRGVEGLGVLHGKVRRFENVFKVPHVGWDQVEILKESRVLAGARNGSYAYFCHSYVAPVVEETVAVTDYGQRFTSVVEKGSLWAVQFHPEKSGNLGLEVLYNFLSL